MLFNGRCRALQESIRCVFNEFVEYIIKTMTFLFQIRNSLAELLRCFRPLSARFFMPTLLLVMLSACANKLPQSFENNHQESALDEAVGEDAVVVANSDQLDLGQGSEIDPDLPLLELSADDLSDLLVMNLASMQQDWQQAASKALSVAERTNDHRLARLATMMFLQQRDHTSAATAAKLWADLQPDNRTARDMKLVALVGDQKIDQAIQTIKQQTQNLDIDRYIREVAGLLVRQRNSEGALAIVEQLTQAHPESAQVHTSSAFVAEHFAAYEQANTWADRALSLRPQWDLAAQMKARLLQTQNKLDERAAFIAQFVEDNPKSVGMRISHAAELSRQENYQQAYQTMLGVIDDAPKDADALQYAGNLAEQLEDSAAAAKHYRRALREEPNNDNVRWSLARLAVIDKKYVTAERLFNDIQSDELYVRAQIQVANMRNETQGHRMAVNTLRALQPRNRNEYIEIALTRHYLLMDAHEYQEALASMNETLVFLPDEVQLLYARALVAAEVNQVDLAEQDLRQVIKLEPTNANAMNALGYTLADQTDRFEEAKVLIEAALEIRPDDAHILDSMGWVLFRLNDLDGAIKFLRRAAEEDDNAEILAHLGEALWASGAKDEALDIWRRGYTLDEKHPALLETLERYEVDLQALPEA